MIGYIMIGVFAIVLIYIVALYLKNSKKIKSSLKKPDAKANSSPEKKDEKVEVKSTISKKTSLEQSIIEENSRISKNEIESAFSQIEAQKQAYEDSLANKNSDSDKSMTELEKSIQRDFNFTMKKKHLRSETAKIGIEGPTKHAEEKQEEKPKEKNEDINKSLANEIQNLSPELKAVLMNDILNKKY